MVAPPTRHLLVAPVMLLCSLKMAEASRAQGKRAEAQWTCSDFPPSHL